MNFKRKYAILVGESVLLYASLYILPRHARLVPLYDRYIFYPFQSLRVIVCGIVPFSIGDVMYVLWGIALLAVLTRWVYYIARYRTYKRLLAASVLDTINTILFIYLFFIFGWGANYYKPPLVVSWQLSSTGASDTILHNRKKSDSTALVAFNRFLVDRLNTYAPHYRYASFSVIEQRAEKYYRLYTDSKVKFHGLKIKPSMFGYFLERADADGYYNPFTGEGQVNIGLPAFVMPFLISHEMAHQAGIAAEGDANLMAYALCTAVDDSSFRYSAYFSIWLYANHRLYHRDSTLAHQFAKQLNPLTTAHIDTLYQISRKYTSHLTSYSAEIYDDYLKMQQQKEGIRSYSNVTAGAWQLEQKRSVGLIHVP